MISCPKKRVSEICGVHIQPGILIVNAYGMWLCGKHLLEAHTKMKEQQRNFIMEGKCQSI